MKPERHKSFSFGSALDALNFLSFLLMNFDVSLRPRDLLNMTSDQTKGQVMHERPASSPSQARELVTVKIHNSNAIFNTASGASPTSMLFDFLNDRLRSYLSQFIAYRFIQNN